MVTVYRSETDKYIKIVSPADHALVNTDMVEVRVLSSVNNNKVTINGIDAEILPEQEGGKKLYWSRIWLKQGFNTITAQCSTDRGIYKDSISVYYNRSEGLFQFTTPFAGRIFKVSDELEIHITGEIGTMYDTYGEKNRVSVTAVFYPRNPNLESRILINEVDAVIEEVGPNESNYQGAYRFYLEQPLSVQVHDLDAGDIELIAYKNKTDRKWDAEIHRFFVIDNSRLWIDLIQPNIYTVDILDTQKKIELFSKPDDPVFHNVTLGNDGRFTLTSSEKRTDTCLIPERVEASDFIELRNGTLMMLVNKNNSMRIYRKTVDHPDWELFIAREDMYGYDLCETELGVLTGVSRISPGTDSGIYLIQENNLINITIGEPVPHVQFISSGANGDVFLYGNYYSHLYTIIPVNLVFSARFTLLRKIKFS